MNKGDELQEILKSHLEPKFREFFNQGLMAGHDACLYELNKQIAPMTSAKAIKDLLKSKCAEADNRGKKNG